MPIIIFRFPFFGWLELICLFAAVISPVFSEIRPPHFYVLLNIKLTIIKTVGQKIVLSDTIAITAAIVNIDFVCLQSCLNLF